MLQISSALRGHWACVSVTRKAAILMIASFLSMLALTSMAYAGKFVLEKKDDPEESYQFSDVEGVCAAYETNLARFSDRPYGMACGRELDPKLGFTRPTWVKLDLLEHADLVKEIYRYFQWDRMLANDPRPWIEQVKSMVARGDVLELADVDIDGDGKPDRLLRFGRERPCDPAKEVLSVMPGRKKMMVADATLTKVLPSSITSSDDVILYRGKAYIDNFFGEPDSHKKRNGILYLYKLGRWATGWGNATVCRFRYVDPTLSKARAGHEGVQP